MHRSYEVDPKVWEIPQAIAYVKDLAELKPWYVQHQLIIDKSLSASRFIEEPTAPDDILGHATIRKALRPYNIGVATGEHCANRILFKQLLQAGEDVC